MDDGYLLPFAVHFLDFPIISSNKGGNRWTIHETVGFLWNMQDISRGSTQAKLTQRQRKFELFNPSQAKLEEQLV